MWQGDNYKWPNGQTVQSDDDWPELATATLALSVSYQTTRCSHYALILKKGFLLYKYTQVLIQQSLFVTSHVMWGLLDHQLDQNQSIHMMTNFSLLFPTKAGDPRLQTADSRADHDWLYSPYGDAMRTLAMAPWCSWWTWWMDGVLLQHIKVHVAALWTKCSEFSKCWKFTQPGQRSSPWLWRCAMISRVWQSTALHVTAWHQTTRQL